MSEVEAVDDHQRVSNSEGYDAGFGRDFKLFALGQAVSIIGDRIALIALVFLVIHLSKSYAPALGLFYVCRVVPTLLMGLLAGVFVDQFDRRKLMIGCDLGRGMLLVLVPVLGSLALASLYPIVIVLYALTLLFDTAARAALPDVIPESKMLAANSVLRGIENSADVAYAVGGVLVFLIGYQAPFYFDAATFLFSASMIGLMRLPSPQRGSLPRLGELLSRIGAGIRYLGNQPFLKWSTFSWIVLPLAGGAGFVLAPLYASHVLNASSGLIGPLRGGAFRFSLLEVALGLGALLGSAMTAPLAQKIPRGSIFGLGVVGAGVCDGSLAFVTNFYAAAGILALSGLFNSLFVIAGVTLVQTLTPSEMRGRVVAARTTIINTSLALGSALAGVALLAVSYRRLWLIEGVVMAASSIFIWLRPNVRNQA